MGAEAEGHENVGSMLPGRESERNNGKRQSWMEVWRGEGQENRWESSELGPSSLAPTTCRAGKPRGALHWRRAEPQFREQSLG